MEEEREAMIDLSLLINANTSKYVRVVCATVVFPRYF